MRVEKLLAHLGIEGISAEIRSLSPRDAPGGGRRHHRATAREGHDAGAIPSRARVDAALRVGLAILTEGILVAPLEGLAEVHLREGPDRAPYIELYYAGPIRAAGGTAQALSVLLADIVRRDLGLAAFRPEPAEVGRYQEEIPLYKYHQHLQYVPTPDEIELVVATCPWRSPGESTEGDAEVSAFRNLPRVPTNGIRGGACLVIAEGLCQKAAKLRKIVEKLGLDGWEFLAELGHPHDRRGGCRTPKYLQDAVGGRPGARPPEPPGWRSGSSTAGRGPPGLAACAVNPATMVILQHFVAIGTQVKLEYPGKATAMGVCDTVDGPIVELDDGTVTAVHDRRRADELLPAGPADPRPGELLVGFGEFLENNRRARPGRVLPRLAPRGAPRPAVDRPGRTSRDVRGRRSDARAPVPGPAASPLAAVLARPHPGEIRALSEFVETDRPRGRGRALELPADPAWRARLGRLGFLFVPDRRDDRLRGEPDPSAGARRGPRARGSRESTSSARSSLDPRRRGPARRT